MGKNVHISVAKNISYSAIAKIVAFAFQALANVLLSRELISSDYGIVNFAMIQITLMTTICNFGLNNAVVQKKTFDDNTLYTAFTIRLIFSSVVFAFIYVLAGFFVNLINDKNIVTIIRVLATTLILNVFGFIPSTLLWRKLEIKKLVFAETVNTIINAIIAIIMALNGFTFWSIVVAYVGSNIVFVIIMNLFLPYKIMFRLDKQIAGELIGYGYKVLLAGLVTFAVFNLDNFVVGAVSGPSVLGYYSLAFNWGSMVCGIMSAVVSNVLFPVFARMQDEPEKLKEKFLVLIRYIAIVCIVWNLTLFCVSDLFLVHVLGKGTQKWLPALNALKILCVYGVVRTIIEFCNTLLMASGNPKLVLKSGIIVAIIEALLIYPAIKYGSIEIVSVLVLLAYMTQAYFTKRYVNRLYNVELKDIIKIFIPSGGAAIVIYASYYIVQKVIPNNLYGLILAVTYVVVAYVLLYGFFTKWKYYSRLYYSIIK